VNGKGGGVNKTQGWVVAGEIKMEGSYLRKCAREEKVDRRDDLSAKKGKSGALTRRTHSTYEILKPETG